MSDRVSYYSNVSVWNEDSPKLRSTYSKAVVHSFQLYGRLGSSKGRFDKLGSISTIPEKESYDSNLRISDEEIAIEPSPRKRSFNIRKHFQFIRLMAMEQAFINTQRNLSLYLSTMICYKQDAEKVEAPYNMFRWSEEDFFVRRRVNNTAWIELFVRQLSKECIENKKLQVGVKEIMKYTAVIHDKFRGQDTDIVSKLQSMYEFLSMSEALQNSFNANTRKELNLGLSYHGRTFKKSEDTVRRNKINELEYTLFESNVYDPIELRYQLRYYDTAVNEFQEKKLSEQDAITKKILDIKKRTRVENYCSECTVNALYVEIGKYRNRIEYMEVLYARQADKFDNKINFKRYNMEKTRAQRSYLEEQLVRFREEIAHIKLLEIKEAERLQFEREEQLNAKLLAEAAKKQRKKKRK